MAWRTLVVAMLLSWACYSFDVPRVPCYDRASIRLARPRSQEGLSPPPWPQWQELSTTQVANATTASATWMLSSSTLMVLFSGGSTCLCPSPRARAPL